MRQEAAGEGKENSFHIHDKNMFHGACKCTLYFFKAIGTFQFNTN